MARDGWVKIWRKLIDTPLWLEEPFTRGQAWIDLILMAKRPDSDNPGAVCCSIMYLCNRWKWSHGKVERFISRLNRDGMVNVHKNGHQNGESFGKLLTVVKYGSYQNRVDQNGERNVHKNGDKNGDIEEDNGGEGVARHADAGGAKERKLPAVFQGKFESYEEYEEWRRINS